MSEIQSVNHGVRAWTREDHPGQGKALGHTRNKFSEVAPLQTPAEPVDTVEISTPPVTPTVQAPVTAEDSNVSILPVTTELPVQATEPKTETIPVAPITDIGQLIESIDIMA